MISDLVLKEIILQGTTVSVHMRTLCPDQIFFVLGETFLSEDQRVQDALAKGACAVVCSHQGPTGSAIFNVDNPLAYLMSLAAFARQNFKGMLIAVNETEGRVTVQEGLRQMLQMPLRNPYEGMLNRLGVPLALVNFDQRSPFGLVPIRLNNPGEFETFTRFAQPNISVLTRKPQTDKERFESFEELYREESDFFIDVDAGVITYDRLNTNHEMIKNLGTEKGCKKWIRFEGGEFSSAERMDAPEGGVETGCRIRFNYPGGRQ